jgi:hypothetical protein
LEQLVSKTLEEIRASHAGLGKVDDIISPPVEDDVRFQPLREFPVQVKWGQMIKYNPEGNTRAPLIAVAYADVTPNGMMELVIIPFTGGETVRKYGVPHESLFSGIQNKNLRRNGSWSAM